MLSVITSYIFYAECHYVEFPHAEYRYAKCPYANAIIAALRLKNINNLPPLKRRQNTQHNDIQHNDT